MRQATVLVVDDEPGIVEGLKDWLEINGHQVITAANGLKALEVLKSQGVDVMITDLRMPGMGGLDLLVQAQKLWPGISAIVLTGHGDLINAIEALNCGASAYLLKPVDLDELGIHLGRCLEQAELRRQLVVSLHHLESVVQSMIDALIVTSREGMVQIANGPACEMLGYAEAELVGQPLSQFFSIEEIFGSQGMEDLYTQGFLRSVETALPSRTHGKTPVLLSGSIRKDSTHGVDGIVLVAKDITEFRKAQDVLRNREAQLVHTGRLTAMGEMAAGIAHELNQPLAVIRIWSQSLSNDVGRGSVSSDRVLEATKEIDQQMKRATTIITHMRAFARGESEEPPEPTDLSGPARDALLFFQEQFRIREIELELDIASHLPKVLLHGHRFEQVVVNLLSNARHAVDKMRSQIPSHQKKVTIRLSSSEDGRWVILQVKDNGVGMSPLERDRCLEPFFTTKEVGQGTGLGLHIIRGIVQELGGQVNVESLLGSGTTFTINLPSV